MRAVHTGWMVPVYFQMHSSYMATARSPLSFQAPESPIPVWLKVLNAVLTFALDTCTFSFSHSGECMLHLLLPLPLAPAYFPTHRQVTAIHPEGFNKLAGGLGREDPRAQNSTSLTSFQFCLSKAVNQVWSKGEVHYIPVPSMNPTTVSIGIEEHQRAGWQVNVFEKYHQRASAPISDLNWTFGFNGSFGKVDRWTFRRAH